MRKSFWPYLSIWCILLITFNAVVFLVPSTIITHNSSFYIGYASTMICYIGQLVCSLFTFKEKNNSKFLYKLPLVTISFVNTIITILFGFALSFISIVSTWLVAIVCIVLLAFSIISLISTNEYSNYISNVDDVNVKKTSFVKEMSSLTLNVYNKNRYNIYLKKLYETIRYMDNQIFDEITIQDFKTHVNSINPNSFSEDDLKELLAVINK